MPELIRSTYTRRPHAAGVSYTPQEVAKAYNYPTTVTGKGVTIGILELGGGFGQADLTAFGIKNTVTSVSVAGGQNKSDGPNGADGEVLLDIEVAASVAPGALIRVYFADNSDAGFLAAVEQINKECQVGSCSWGQSESDWAAASMVKMDAAFAAGRAAGVNWFVAAGDSGADDGTGKPSVDFPASSPNVVGCGGTRLTVDASGARAAEVVWDDSDTTSATGGGVSKQFPSRQVPDVAGNADPDTGYQVIVDGGHYVIGGTSAVAPLLAGLCALLHEAVGAFDFLKTVGADPTVCFDVTSGDNGAFRAGPGRDDTTGYGVVDGAKLLAVLQAAPVTPTPPAPPVQPAPPSFPVPPVPPTPVASTPSARDIALWNSERHWVMDIRHIHGTPAYEAALALQEWALDLGLPLTPHAPEHSA